MNTFKCWTATRMELHRLEEGLLYLLVCNAASSRKLNWRAPDVPFQPELSFTSLPTSRQQQCNNNIHII